MTGWQGRGLDPPRPIANAAQDFVDLTPTDGGAFAAEIAAAYASLLPDSEPDVHRYWDDEEGEWP